MRTCLFCGKEIPDDVRGTMVGVDKPYINVWFHKEHYPLVKDRLNEFLSENIELIYSMKKAEISAKKR